MPLLVAVLALIASTGLAVSSAAAAPARELSLTVVARECPTYEAISANLARNNLMESLRDLGPGTAYTPGDLIDPDVEASAQPIEPGGHRTVTVRLRVLSAGRFVNRAISGTASEAEIGVDAASTVTRGVLPHSPEGLG